MEERPILWLPPRPGNKAACGLNKKKKGGGENEKKDGALMLMSKAIGLNGHWMWHHSDKEVKFRLQETGLSLVCCRIQTLTDNF